MKKIEVVNLEKKCFKNKIENVMLISWASKKIQNKAKKYFLMTNHYFWWLITIFGDLAHYSKEICMRI